MQQWVNDLIIGVPSAAITGGVLLWKWRWLRHFFWSIREHAKMAKRYGEMGDDLVRSNARADYWAESQQDLMARYDDLEGRLRQTLLELHQLRDVTMKRSRLIKDLVVDREAQARYIDEITKLIPHGLAVPLPPVLRTAALNVLDPDIPKENYGTSL